MFTLFSAGAYPGRGWVRASAPAMAEALLQWEPWGGGGKSNDQISFVFDPYLAGPHAVTCPIYVGFRPTVLASI